MSAPPHSLTSLFSPGLVSDQYVFRTARPQDQPKFEKQPRAPFILASLRHALVESEGGQQELLASFADAARVLTGASGVAVGLRRENKLICLARSGALAPELGTRMSEKSGLAALCLRGGKPVFCNETLTDARVDPRMCRRIGVRSIAAVPLRARGEIVGLVEAFSERAGAFTREQMDFLVHIAKVVESSKRGGFTAALADTDSGSEPKSSQWPQSDTLFSSQQKAPSPLRKFFPYAAAMGILMVAVAWAAWHYTVDPSDQVETAQASAQLSTEEHATQTAKLAASIAAPIERTPAPQPVPPATPSEPQATPADLSPSPAAALAVTPEQNLTPVAAAVLEHRVEPVYPRDAARAGIQGTVVLEATIGEDGTVESVKVVKGNSLLAKSAVEAAKKWRYRPFTLNGKPTKALTGITFNFKAS